MSEIISIHIGQAGCQIGNTMWELYCMESGICPDGHLMDGMSEEFSTYNSFYSHTQNNEYHPRCLFVDSDHNNTEVIRNLHPALYNQNQFVSDNSCIGGIYACRYSVEGERLGERVMEQVRKLSETCHKKPDFWIFNSTGGGTGSGIGSLVSREIQEEFKKEQKIQVTVSPEPDSSIAENYNTFLAFAALHETIDLSFHFSNKKMREIIRNNRNFLEVPDLYSNFNQLICLALSSVTYGSRLKDEPINTDFIVPYPSMHYPLLSYYTPPGIRERAQVAAPVVTLTAQGIHKNNTMLPLDPRNGYSIYLRIIYRGDVVWTQVRSMINKLFIANRVLFGDFTACNYKMELQQHSPFISPERDILRTDRSVCVLSNNTVFSDRIAAIKDSVSEMLKKKAFMHWYLRDGVENEEFEDSKTLLESILDDYIDVQPPDSPLWSDNDY